MSAPSHSHHSQVRMNSVSRPAFLILPNGEILMPEETQVVLYLGLTHLPAVRTKNK